MSETEENPWMAFGLTYSLDVFDLLAGIVGEEKLSAEGTSASGYELHLRQSDLGLVELLRLDAQVGEMKIEFYQSPRRLSGSSRYDRLVDHFAGLDPFRPPLAGISFGDGVVQGIVRKP